MTYLDLGAPALLADPYLEFGRMREQAPVLRGRYLDHSPIWYVTRFEEVRAVLSDGRFVNHPPGPGSPRDRYVQSLGIPENLVGYLSESILDADGEKHVRLRKLVSRAFTVRRVTELRPSVETITEGLLDRLAAGDGPVDLIEAFCYPLPITVICDLVGIPVADRPAWRAWSEQMTRMNPEGFGPLLREVVDYLHALIDLHREAGRDDLLSALIRTHDEDGDRLSDAELVTMVLSLVFAGHETTAHLIGNATLALLTHPDQLAALRADPGLWPGAVHELMRWCGPVQITALRYATVNVELGGETIRSGEAVQPVLVSANYDPREYPGPDRLDVTRRPHAHGDGHVGFGHGPHYCLGAALARQETEVALRGLVARFAGLTLAANPAELHWDPIPGSRRLTELPVAW